MFGLPLSSLTVSWRQIVSSDEKQERIRREEQLIADAVFLPDHVSFGARQLTTTVRGLFALSDRANTKKALTVGSHVV